MTLEQSIQFAHQPNSTNSCRGKFAHLTVLIWTESSCLIRSEPVDNPCQVQANLIHQPAAAVEPGDEVHTWGQNSSAHSVPLSPSGFGSFVDKVVDPYVSTVEAKLANPCIEGGKGPCQPAFSFKHVLKLTEDVEEFERKVSQQSYLRL